MRVAEEVDPVETEVGSQIFDVIEIVGNAVGT
jgi:hypothetical protein